jgi:hypothetical protein
MYIIQIVQDIVRSYKGCGLGSIITANSILSNGQNNIQSDRNFLELRGELVDTTTQ